jgi:hypothetical protein
MIAMLVRRAAIATATLLAFTSLSQAQSATCTFKYFKLSSNLTRVLPHNINNYGTVVGQVNSKIGQNEQAFIYYSDGTYKLFALNGNLPTEFNARNNSGVTVGDFGTAAHRWHGLVYVNGKTSEVDYPGALNTWLMGINKNSTMVGFYQTVSGGPYFGFRLASGTFTKIMYPGSQWTQPYAINDNGVIVGTYYVGTTGNTVSHGFVLENGVYRTLDDPKGVPGGGTYLGGINNSGMIAGTYIPASTNDNSRAFLYKNNTFYDLNVPNATVSTGTGVNAQEQVTGNVLTSSADEGYIASCQ